jgi:HK97 family phage portal protein
MSILRRGVGDVVGRYPQFNNYVAPLSQLYGQTQVSSSAGERIDEWTALGISSVMNAVSLLADSVASMPLRCYIQEDGYRKVVSLPEILKNPDPVSGTNEFEFIHQVIVSMALHGNAYIHIDRDRRGVPIGLVPLHPYQMQVLPTGDAAGRQYLHLGNEMDSENIMHLRWFTPPQSLVGISPLIQSRNLVGLSLAMDRHLAQFYAEGGTPSGVLETSQKLTIDQARTIQGTWEATHRRHRRPAVLADGLTFKPITTSAADQQMIQTREQLVRDIARVYRIPSNLMGVSGDGMTYQNVEQSSINFLTHTVTPWLRRLEIGFSRVLDPGTDVLFDVSSILRTDSMTRARVNAVGIMHGVLTPNEARQSVGLEPYEGGDAFHQALPGAVTAGGDLPPLGVDADNSAPVMGVLESNG